VSKSVRQRQNRFLRAFPKVGTVSKACATSHVSRTSVYRWLKEDAEFAERFADAEKQLSDALDAECLRRGWLGVEDYVTHGGQVVFLHFDEEGNHVPAGDPMAVRREPYRRRVYSDKLLLEALRARDQRYAERSSVNVTATTSIMPPRGSREFERMQQEDREMRLILEDPELAAKAEEFARLQILKMEQIEAEQNGSKS
jgi:hypothetical protein